MVQDFDIRRFFQKAPRDWLRRYFEHYAVLSNFDLDSLKKLKVDRIHVHDEQVLTKLTVEPLLEAWEALDEEPRRRMTDDFRNINLLASFKSSMRRPTSPTRKR